MQVKIEHIALWTNDLEKLTAFYVNLFAAHASNIYENKQKKFRSCFVSFSSGTRLEIMTTENLSAPGTDAPGIGIAHFCVAVGSRQAVDEFTEHCRNLGIPIAGQPRTTGDGYYESVILDPDGNRIEITA